MTTETINSNFGQKFETMTNVRVFSLNCKQDHLVDTFGTLRCEPVTQQPPENFGVDSSAQPVVWLENWESDCAELDLTRDIFSKCEGVTPHCLGEI